MVFIRSDDDFEKAMQRFRGDQDNDCKRPRLGRVFYNSILKSWEAEFLLTTKDIITGGDVMFTDDKKQVDHCLFNHKIRIILDENEKSQIQKLYSDNWKYIREEVKRLHESQ